MTVTLITGANKGLGFETARHLLELGHTVYIGARDVERGEKAAATLGARFVQLDVIDDASVSGALGFIGLLHAGGPPLSCGRDRPAPMPVPPARPWASRSRLRLSPFGAR